LALGCARGRAWPVRRVVGPTHRRVAHAPVVGDPSARWTSAPAAVSVTPPTRKGSVRRLGVGWAKVGKVD
jgi:hypothetical protein